MVGTLIKTNFITNKVKITFSRCCVCVGGGGGGEGGGMKCQKLFFN